MPRDYRLYLDDILESINLINEYTAGLDIQDFSADRKIQDAVVRNLEIIGEATKNLPNPIKEQFPEIEWINQIWFIPFSFCVRQIIA